MNQYSTGFAEMTEATEKKVFMTSDNMATFVCPKCEKAKTVDVSQYKNINKAVRVKCRCTCRHTYTVLLERRKHFRKKTKLFGQYYFGSPKNRGLMTVTDISRTGLKFEVSVTPHFKIGDTLFVDFELDDSHKTLIKKEVIVRSINGLRIGVEFRYLDPDDYYNNKIGFYLFN